jgi:hypothetical protein
VILSSGFVYILTLKFIVIFTLLSGLLSAVITVTILGVLRYFEFPVTIIADKYVQFLVTGLIYAYLLGVLLYIRGGRAHLMAQNPFAMTGSFVYDLWMGREVNPRIGPFDVKVCMLRIGMIGMVSCFDNSFLQ